MAKAKVEYEYAPTIKQVTVTLSKKEAEGLTNLLGWGTSAYTLDALNLRSLLQELKMYCISTSGSVFKSYAAKEVQMLYVYGVDTVTVNGQIMTVDDSLTDETGTILFLTDGDGQSEWYEESEID